MTERKIHILSCLLSFVLGVGIGVGGYGIAQEFTSKSPIEIEQGISADNSGAIFSAVNDKGEGMKSGVVYDLPRVVSFTSTAVAANSQGVSVTVNAVVTPDTAVNKKVDWSVSWAENGSGRVTDFVNVVPTSDGSTTAEITCYKPFTGDIIVTVTTRDGGYTADCVVSFVGVPSSISVSSSQVSLSNGAYGLGVSKTYDFDISLNNVFGQVGEKFKEYTYHISATGTLTIGTAEKDARAENYEWYDEHSVSLSELQSDIIECSIEGSVLHVTFNKSIEGYYSSMKRQGTVRTYYDKVKSVDSACSFTITVQPSNVQTGSLKASIKVIIDNTVATGVSVSGSGFFEF